MRRILLQIQFIFFILCFLDLSLDAAVSYSGHGDGGAAGRSHRDGTVCTGELACDRLDGFYDDSLLGDAHDVVFLFQGAACP